MKKANLYYLSFLLLLGGLVFGFAQPDPEKETPPSARSPQEPAGAAFDQMMAVLTHKRCVNCHPSGDRPRQGEDSHYHYFGVQRGADGHGVVALQCSTCHQEANNDFAGVPGAPHWHLAPRSMAWEGLSRVEIAESMLDPARNGDRDLEEIVHHLTEDPLVLWAFEPGVDHAGNLREQPPVSKADFIQAVKDWAAAGAQIPAE